MDPRKSNQSLVRLVGLFKRLVDPQATQSFSLGGYVDSLTSTPYSLANAYLKVYCEADADLARRYRFETVTIVDLSRTGHLDPVEEVRLRKQDVASLLEGGPTALCFSCYAWNVEAAMAACAEVKQQAPDVVTVLGGRAVEAVGHAIVSRFPFIDFIINGEGELPFAELARQGFAKSNPIPGVTFSQTDAQGRRSVVSMLPGPPVMELGDIPSPFLNGAVEPSVDGLLMELSRGCSHDCGYCAWNSCKIRRRFPAQRIGQELAWAVANGVRHITFIDSAINYETALLEEFSRELAQADPQRTLEFTFNLRHEDLDQQQFELLEQIPARQILLGMETLSDPAMEASNRSSFDTTRFRSVVHQLSKCAPPVVGVVLGLPDDTLDGFKRTMEYLGSINDEIPGSLGGILVSLLQVYPSTRLHKDARRFGMNIRPRGIPYVLGHNSFPLEELKRALVYLQLFRLRRPGLVKGPEGQAALLGKELQGLFMESVAALLVPHRPGDSVAGFRWLSTTAYSDGEGFGAFHFSAPGQPPLMVRLDGRDPRKPCFTHTSHFNIYFSEQRVSSPAASALMAAVKQLVLKNELLLPLNQSL